MDGSESAEQLGTAFIVDKQRGRNYHPYPTLNETMRDMHLGPL
jgi:hypothetical protein